uniref:Uncharacterized protein n=1 Tax=Rhizophora mucronata TaxID=61149 RepID=A0A2P2P6M8_RHIMU
MLYLSHFWLLLFVSLSFSH